MDQGTAPAVVSPIDVDILRELWLAAREKGDEEAFSNWAIAKGLLNKSNQNSFLGRSDPTYA